jgi:hypothetical protein
MMSGKRMLRVCIVILGGGAVKCRVRFIAYALVALIGVTSCALIQSREIGQEQGRVAQATATVQANDLPVVDWHGWALELKCCDKSTVVFHPQGWSPTGVGALRLTTLSPTMLTQIAEAAEQVAGIHVWGTLTCELPYNGGCLLSVTRIRRDDEPVAYEPDTVEGWQGILVDTPEQAQPGLYFVLSGAFPAWYRVSQDSHVDASDLDSYRDARSVLRVWGRLKSEVGVGNGSEIVLTRVKSLS